MLLCPSFSLMDQHSLIQHFHHIISVASLTYTFTTLHTIQYLMWDHDHNTTAEPTEDHVLTNISALSSTHDTPTTTSASENIENTSSQWTEDEIHLLLDFVKANCILMTARGLNLKKSEFNKARATVKSKDANQCHYKWSHVCILLINKVFHH